MSRAGDVRISPPERQTCETTTFRREADETTKVGGGALLGLRLGVYRLDAILGWGAVGVVYRAWDYRAHRVVALKLLRVGLLATPEDRHSFRQEALALRRLSHPNVTAILDFGTTFGRDYLVMEFVPGQTLSDLLDGQAMASGHVAYLGEQLARGLQAAHHAGVVHRDVKPQNLRLTPDGQLKILDFGLARDATPEFAGETRDAAIVGTVPYMAPEQLTGGRVDGRTDVYGAGVVLYEMACGCRPFGADVIESLVTTIKYEQPRKPSLLNPAIWPSLEALILRALAKDPAARPQSARAFAAALARLSAERLRWPFRFWVNRFLRMPATAWE